MSITVFFLAAAVWLYLRRVRSCRTGAGASAAARARQLRTLAVRLAELFGIRTQAGALADRFEAGAEGERRTARRLAPLRLRGWTLLHDRALPYGRANVDHLAISPRGVVLVLDTKRWSARWPVSVQAGRLLHGGRDVTHRLDGLQHEASTVAGVLGVPVIPVAVIDGPALRGEPLELDGVRIIPAEYAARRLRTLAAAHRGYGRRIADQADRLLPPYANGPAR
ncbi:nuclease-related domain-containing protein [Streptomyces justiciae]|uniref:Nuclease-related domain-containing protein n=1 Tax=Streptomyces justiciae TaxID=2780140 RepID=A0ABU3M6U5_9ACTN|nr:nuclease-related domain-containing protein [Streptomyces justiciae]MDT7847224.1 nuclease-related domain-containing protein [Streptomyces justiciae]